jgi:hypothetical protein
VKLVQTLVVRDEADVVGAQIAYHLDAGVDLVIATDHESLDGTTEILESYARGGHLLRIPVHGAMRDGPWRTRMARLAAAEHGADWVINTDADEFWLPREGTLKEVLAAVPKRYGIVCGLSRHFVPRPDDGTFFAERMTVRVSTRAAINDPSCPYRPHQKVAHRGDPAISVGFGSHRARSGRWPSLHHWYVSDVLHFPFRSLEQWERKGVRRARGDKALGQYVRALQASEEGRSSDRYGALVVDDATVAKGVAAGSLVVDTRLRDALRSVGGERTTRASSTEVRDPGARTDVIAEGAALREADVVRLVRHLDGLRARLPALEESVWARASHRNGAAA